MKTLKIFGLSILTFIGIIIISVVVALTILFGYFSLQLFIVGRGDYLLFVSDELNMIPVFMIILLSIYALIIIKEKLFKNKEKLEETIEDEEPVDVSTLNRFEKLIYKLLNILINMPVNKLKAIDDMATKIFKIIKFCYLPALMIAIYCGMTSYAILYDDSIKVSSPIEPRGVIYKYSDMKNINVGVGEGYKKSYSPYYEVVFNDGKSVDLFGGSMQEDKDIGFEYVLIDLDEKLRSQGVNKTVDKENFEKYSNGLNEEFISRVEKLFEVK